MKKYHFIFVILRWAWKIVITLLGIFVIFLAYMQITNYNPTQQMPLELRGNKNNKENRKDTYSIITWNIGYSGLGAEMDFFYDGGKGVRPGYAEYQKYLDGITGFLAANNSVDVMLLQEVDRNSKRSYHHNQVHHIMDTLKNYNAVFAKNYDVPFVPLPIASPLGRVDAGMMTLSRLRPMMNYRYSLPQSHSWPKSLFMLDRAIIMSTFPLPNQKRLVVLNIHNSAYANEKEARQNELEVVKSLAESEYKKENYVIIGGDWNQNPPDFKPDSIPNGKSVGFTLTEDYIGKDWKWAYDKNRPTNRFLDAPYSEETKTTIIDFYRLSPNLSIEKVEVLEQGFQYSDHEPVYLKVRLN